MRGRQSSSRRRSEGSLEEGNPPSSVIQRFATPDEVAAMLAYVCSAQTSATTPAALRVDGGVVRAIA
jgi:NAD(P)-dependent dehydrogenase (short-subunit alcohol dehydrogenase family)